MSNKNIILAIVLTGFIVISCNKSNKEITKLDNDKQKASYAIGTSLGLNATQNIKQLESSLPLKDSINKQEIITGMKEFMTSMSSKSPSYFQGVQLGLQIEGFLRSVDSLGIIDNDVMIQGLLDKLNGKSNLLVKEEDMQKILEGYLKPIQEKSQLKIKKRVEARATIKKKENLEKSTKFLAANKTATGVKTKDSGLQYKIVKEGDKAKFPTETDLVKVIYTGKTSDGKEFDSSKGQATDIPLGQVIPGWKEGLKMMSKGAKYIFYIPPTIGYGENGNQTIDPNETLIFEVELVDFSPAPKQPAQKGGQPQIVSPEQMKAVQKQVTGG